MGDGVGTVFKWWLWLGGQYAVTFLLASIMGFIAIIVVPGAALHFSCRTSSPAGPSGRWRFSGYSARCYSCAEG